MQVLAMNRTPSMRNQSTQLAIWTNLAGLRKIVRLLCSHLARRVNRWWQWGMLLSSDSRTQRPIEKWMETIKPKACRNYCTTSSSNLLLQGKLRSRGVRQLLIAAVGASSMNSSDLSQWAFKKMVTNIPSSCHPSSWTSSRPSIGSAAYNQYLHSP